MILPIAIGQIQLENQLSKKANKILICDTDILETKVYSEKYYDGFVPNELNQAIKRNHYDLYLLTYIDTPWEKDDLRDKPNERLEMFTAFENALQQHQKKYLLLKGNKETRFKNAISTINKIVLTKKDFTTLNE